MFRVLRSTTVFSSPPSDQKRATHGFDTAWGLFCLSSLVWTAGVSQCVFRCLTLAVCALLCRTLHPSHVLCVWKKRGLITASCCTFVFCGRHHPSLTSFCLLILTLLEYVLIYFLPMDGCVFCCVKLRTKLEC